MAHSEDEAAPMKILACTLSASDNGIVRVQQLWQAARALGHEMTIAHSGGEMWAPLRGGGFEEHCFDHRGTNDPTLHALARDADVIVAFKPLKRSFGLALGLRRLTGTPVLLDIDDPDLEARLRTPRGLAKVMLKPAVRIDGSVRELRRLQRATRSVVRTTVNPVMHERWGGFLVPHVSDAEAGAEHTTSDPQVAFIGTIQRHKGVHVLRAAVRRLAHLGYTLLLTGRRPADAHPWEHWVESNTWAEGRAMQASSDIIAVPSLRSVISDGQLPAKACDAMLSGRAVIASDIGPLPWAIDDAGITVPPGDVDALAEGLLTLRDPSVRARLGQQARQRAQDLFSLDAVAPRFDRALRQAAQHARQPSGATTHGVDD